MMSNFQTYKLLKAQNQEEDSKSSKFASFSAYVKKVSFQMNLGVASSSKEAWQS